MINDFQKKLITYLIIIFLIFSVIGIIILIIFYCGMLYERNKSQIDISDGLLEESEESNPFEYSIKI